MNIEGSFWKRRWLPVVNDENLVIPPHGAMEITGADYDSATGEIVFSVRRPASDSLQNVLFNSHEEIAEYGNGAGTMDFPCAAYSTEAAGCSAGLCVGTAVNSYSLFRGNHGFIVMAKPSTTKLIIRKQDVFSCYYGTAGVSGVSSSGNFTSWSNEATLPSTGSHFVRSSDSIYCNPGTYLFLVRASGKHYPAGSDYKTIQVSIGYNNGSFIGPSSISLLCDDGVNFVSGAGNAAGNAVILYTPGETTSDVYFQYTPAADGTSDISIAVTAIKIG